MDKILWFYPSNETSWAVPLQSTRGGAWLAPPLSSRLLFLDQTEAQKAEKNFFYVY